MTKEQHNNTVCRPRVPLWGKLSSSSGQRGEVCSARLQPRTDLTAANLPGNYSRDWDATYTPSAPHAHSHTHTRAFWREQQNNLSSFYFPRSSVPLEILLYVIRFLIVLFEVVHPTTITVGEMNNCHFLPCCKDMSSTGKYRFKA